MTIVDNSWDSLTKPGEAYAYFTGMDKPELQIDTKRFNLLNACLLADISRLIYHPDFYNKESINYDQFDFDLLHYIENKETSTNVALLKVNQTKPCLVIAFRGTDDAIDWSTNIQAHQHPFTAGGKVHGGFKNAYFSIQDSLFDFIKNNELPTFITGHSLGAALATLASAELYKKGYFDSCYTFGSPRVGNPDFVKLINCDQIYRIINNSDVVTTVPIDFASIKYQHIGKPVLIDSNNKLHEDKDNDDVDAYQLESLYDLKDYAVSKIINKNFKSIKNDLPSYLADHAPINYFLRLRSLLKN